MTNLKTPSPEKLALANPELFCGGLWYTLPIPPSSNNLYAGKSRRFKTPAYKRWIEEAGWQLRDIKVRPVKGWYRLHIRLPVKMRGDNDNRHKALSDLLVRHGLTPDDNRCWDSRQTRDHNVKPKTCQFRLEAVL